MRSSAQLAGVLRERMVLTRSHRWTYFVVGAVYCAFLVSTVPGVRPSAGYNLVLDGVLNNLAYIGSAAVCLLRARDVQAYRRSFHVLGAGLTLYGLGNIVWTLFVRTQDPEPFPSPADGLWLSFYPCAFIALYLIVRELADDVPLSLWLDGVVGGLAVAGVAAAFFGPVLAATGGSAAAVVTTFAYPLLDVLLLLVVTALLALFRWRPPVGLWCMAAGLALFSVADAVYLFAASAGTYQPGGPVDAVWVLATLVMAFSAGQSTRPTGIALPTWATLGFPVISTLAALSLLVYDHDHALHPLAIALCTATIVLALGRLIVTFREAHSLADSRRLALTDELTGLGNRRAFYEALGERLAAGETGALLLLDVDRFKEVNDSLGHPAGDTLLQQLTARLSGAVRGEKDLLVRLGGDELALLVAGADEALAMRVAAQLRDVLATPFHLEGVTVRVSASVGIALYPEHGDAPSGLLRRADVAMYQAKAATCDAVLYDAGTDEFGDSQRLRDVELLRQTINDRGLVLHYQPKVSAITRAVTGVEALVRWEHPVRGLLMPAAFLPLVEDSGLMHDLTEAVLEQSLDQVARWRSQGRLLSVAVNLSASSLVDIELPARVRAALAHRRLTPDVLELEITEDFLMADRERARDILGELRVLGVRIAVDDFGTGYSSLSYLRELPIDELKLDRSFVQPMAGDARAAAIVRSTIDLAHALGMTMVAEGVEDEETAHRLAGSACDTVQGFFYSQALPAAQLESWVDRWHTLVRSPVPTLRLAATSGDA